MSKERFDIICFDGGTKVIEDLNGKYGWYSDVEELEAEKAELIEFLKNLNLFASQSRERELLLNKFKRKV